MRTKVYKSQLIEEAVQAFKSRVAIVGKQMDEEDYRIIDMDIHTHSQLPQLIYLDVAESPVAGMAAASRAAPVVEAGTSKVVASVSGTVQFY